jgi:hypothetical protein
MSIADFTTPFEFRFTRIGFRISPELNLAAWCCTSAAHFQGYSTTIEVRHQHKAGDLGHTPVHVACGMSLWVEFHMSFILKAGIIEILALP